MISEIETTNGAQEGCNQSFKLSTGSGCQIRDQLMRVFKNQREDLPYTEGQTQPGATPLGVTSGCALAEEEACNHYQGLLQREEKNSPRDGLTCKSYTLLSPPASEGSSPSYPTHPRFGHLSCLLTLLYSLRLPLPVTALCVLSPVPGDARCASPTQCQALLFFFHQPGRWKCERGTKPPSRERTHSPRA